MTKTAGLALPLGILLALGAIGLPHPVTAQERVYHPFHLPAEHNWAFRDQFPAVDRLFNAFDFGHGILYETLWTRPDAPPSLLEEDTFRRLTREILPNAPRLPMPEGSFMPRYARLVPRAKEMFEWAHVLHRQSYDILADPRLSEEDRDRAMAELLRHYRSSDLAFPVEPKGMEIMDGQYFSQVFRERYPRFNGLIWAYHWLQVAVYEPLLAYSEPEARQAAVNATLVRFWQMMESPPSALPTEMPMTPAIAPLFTERYPEFAAIFDNLHMMHDVISDILVSQDVPRGETRSEIYRQTDLFRDPAAMATSREAWIAMALAHGVDAQGGPALGWLPEAPTLDPEEGHHDEGHHDEGHPHAPHGDHHHMHPHEPQAADPAPAGHDHAATDPDAVRSVVRDFHSALAAGDSVGALAHLHPDVRIYEQGVAETLSEYRSHHLGADMRFAASVRREVLSEEVIPGDGVAVYLAEFGVSGRVGEREVDLRGVETAVLVHTADGWVIRHLHWSNR